MSRSGSGTGGRRGATDKDRRGRIIRAAIEVVSQRGVAGLTHRAVALAAGVPLGSTTYYFKTLDDILVAAIEAALADSRQQHEEWGSSLHQGVDLAEALAQRAETVTGPGRARLLVEYELYLAALRHPPLRPLSDAWSKVLVGVLIRHTDPVMARALATINGGLELESLISGRPVQADEAQELYRRVLRASR